MKARDGDVLPYLAPIEEAGGLDAIILTHAHTDHSGGLPVIHQSYPHVPVYMTAATLTLTTILLMDSLKIMQAEFEQEGEIPLYPLPAVELLIGSSRPVEMCLPLEIFGGDIRLTFTPAGHILGAATVLIESADGVILMGGDVSVTDQMTIPGMMSPPASKPDLVVMESTYGGRFHADRSAEEGRLIERAKDVLTRGGGILFPAFAVGRAQEVILIISKAMEQGAIPKAPIFVDGMVRAVCQAYRSYPELLTKWLRKRLETKGNPFYPADGHVVPVYKPGFREKYANTRPSVYVSSSGMLTGGPSPYYAKKLAPNPKNCIAITGYQDEESPGRRVQNVARAGGGMLRLYDEEVDLKCEVGTYGLSAHADTEQLVNALSVLEPMHISLVHGDHGAREALEEALHAAHIKQVHRPTIGSSLEIQPQRRRWTKTPKRETDQPLRSIDELTVESSIGLGQKLLDRDGTGRNYTIPEILFAFGIQQELDDEIMVRAAEILKAKESPFKQDKKRGFLYRLRVDNRGNLWSLEQSQSQKKNRKADLNPILELVAALFPPKTGMYKRKVQLAGPAIRLFFQFPKVQAHTPEVQQAMEQFEEETGWAIRIHEQANQHALAEHLQEIMPSSWKPKKNPAIHLGDEQVSIKLAAAPDDVDQLQEIKETFLRDTGFALDVTYDQVPNSPDPIIITSGASSKNSELPEVTEPLEINQAYQLIRQGFQDQPHQLLKCSLKGQLIELAFISPQVGARYQTLIERLQRQVGWPLRIKPHANQHKIKERASDLIPASWGLTKSPGFYEQGGYVSVRLAQEPSEEEWKEIAARFEQETGFLIKLG